MKQMPSTLYIFLKQEWITVGVYCIATLLFFVIIFAGGHDSNSIDPSSRNISNHQFITILLISMLSIFVGLYLGSGFLRLKQSHLWKTLPSYKQTLVASFVAAAAIYAVIQSVPMVYAGWGLATALLAPTAVTLLTAQAVIGSNFMMKVILPVSPFVLFQLTQFEVNPTVILGLLVLFAGLAVYLNYHNKKIENQSTLGLMSGNLEQQLKSASFQKVNSWIGDIFIKLGVKNQSTNLAVALMRPNNRFGITSIVGSLLSLLFIYSMGDDKIEIEGLAAFMLTSIFLGVFIELKVLAKQCKPFAHLYSGKNYWVFKQKVLTTLQKYLVVQGAVYIILLSLLDVFLNDFVDSTLLVRYVITITLTALIFLPAFLCVNWSSINVKLLAVVLLYIASSIVLCGWLYKTQSVSYLYFQIGLTGAGLVVIASLARAWWKTQPIELFLRTHR
jgi:hypothetical protein